MGVPGRRGREGEGAGASGLAGETAHRAAALREVAEEAGLALPDPAALIPFSRWITPAQIAIRFDTHFFLAAAPPDQQARADGEEMVDLGWYSPAGALEAYARGELELVFPTIKHLEQLARFARADGCSRGRTDARSSPSSRAWSTSPARRPGSSCRGNPGTVTDWVAIGVPIDSVGRAGGTEHAPAAVREHGLLERIGAGDRGDLDVRIRGDERDPETGIHRPQTTCSTSRAPVRAAVRDSIAAGERPLVLGGCCSLVPGALAGLRDAAGAAGRGERRRPRRRLRRRQLAHRRGRRHARSASRSGASRARWVAAAGGP